MAMPTLDLQQSRRFRDTMGRFATGVTIVTTRDGENIHGMTANGFLSVSLEPQLVLISVRNASRMLASITSAGAYGVSVLASGQRDLSGHFAGKPVSGLEVPFVESMGVPVVDGALAQIAAVVVDSHVAGDHTLLIGEVTSFELTDGAPLIFHAGAYRSLVERYEWTATWGHPDLHWY
jgi:flavin reductase (DIM6/NTAB) family NADH-FMN oxidoreductase RutF